MLSLWRAFQKRPVRLSLPGKAVKIHLKLKLLAGICVAVAVGGILIVLSTAHPASDDRMIANFVGHRAEFEQLLTMIRGDKGLSVVAPEWTEPRDVSTVGVSAERLEQYRSLCERLGLREGIRSYSGDIEFLYITRSFLTDGTTKGYAWKYTGPDVGDSSSARIVANIDDAVEKWTAEARASSPHLPHVYLYRPIGEHWYLFYNN